jgi:hypothetical protein
MRHSILRSNLNALGWRKHNDKLWKHPRYPWALKLGLFKVKLLQRVGCGFDFLGSRLYYKLSLKNVTTKYKTGTILGRFKLVGGDEKSIYIWDRPKNNGPS